MLGTFLDALGDAGHTATVSDLYAMGFRSVLTLEGYERESSYRADTPVAADEHHRLNAADGRWAVTKARHLREVAAIALSI